VNAAPAVHGTRRAGVLLHLTSLPSPFANGVCGAEALAFIDQLADNACRVWQFLPLGPTHGHGSPYETLSTFAGNAELIDLRGIAESQWLSEDELAQVIAGQCTADIARGLAAKRFFASLEQDASLQQAWSSFQEQQHWLNDFAAFTAIKEAYQDAAWWQWPEQWKQYHATLWQEAASSYPERFQQTCFEQFIFDRQWQMVKQHADSRGVILFGDLPIYVAHDSSDVWSNASLFTLNDAGVCTYVAGVPPDYFSATGQRWGNPLYRWDVMAEDGFQWWQQRVAHQLRRMHWMRIDHFRGLEAYWAIPGDQPDGRMGEWHTAPGAALLQSLNDALGTLPLIAEDLGLITEEVTALRRAFHLPGMKILHFAFGGDASNPYLPHNHEVDSVVYTGTHDNDTTVGWYNSIEPHVRRQVCDYLATDDKAMPWAFIRAALASTAELAIIPMQDLLALPSSARFNTPSTIKNNWNWRLDSLPENDAECWQQLRGMIQLYGR